jgi:hypothetical protein
MWIRKNSLLCLFELNDSNALLQETALRAISIALASILCQSVMDSPNLGFANREPKSFSFG